MRKLWVLIKLNFRAMLNALSFGRGKARKAGGAGAMVLLAFLALYMSGVYSFTLGHMLSGVGLLDMMLPIMALMACVMALVLTLFAASGMVFGGKDSDIMLALPVPAFTVMLSKILALYLENFVFCALWMLPTSAAYIVFGGKLSVVFILAAVCVALFLPLLSTLLGVIGGWILAFSSAHTKHKSIVGVLVGCALLAVVLVGSLQMNRVAALFLQNTDAVQRILSTWLLPFGLMMRAMTGSALALVGFILICTVPFLAVVWLFSTQGRTGSSPRCSKRSAGAILAPPSISSTRASALF